MKRLSKSLRNCRSAQHVRRLILQAEIYDPLTRRFFREAGIEGGMRVLDIGSGPGAVACVVSELVGPAGSVIGIDQDPVMVETARRRADEANAKNVAFVCGDIERMCIAGQFNAVVGRFVLRELSTAARTLRQLAALVLPGGIVAFQEKVLAIPIRSFPPLSRLEQMCGWMEKARRLSGVEVTTGTKLAALYVAAGLPTPFVRFDAPIGRGSAWAGYAYLVETLRGMMPLIEFFGIADKQDIEVDTLEDQIRAQAANVDAVTILTPCIGAWAAR